MVSKMKLDGVLRAQGTRLEFNMILDKLKSS